MSLPYVQDPWPMALAQCCGDNSLTTPTGSRYELGIRNSWYAPMSSSHDHLRVPNWIGVLRVPPYPLMILLVVVNVPKKSFLSNDIQPEALLSIPIENESVSTENVLADENVAVYETAP